MTKRSFLPLIMALATFFCMASCDKEDPANPGNNTQSSEIDYFADFEVSTSIKKRCAIIEEYTGTKCGACPDGHERVRKIMEKYPGKVFSITIHQGPFAPQYATQWGDAFASQAGVNSYPAGTISRTVYEDGIQQDRTKWDTRCANIKNQRTIVNLAKPLPSIPNIWRMQLTRSIPTAGIWELKCQDPRDVLSFGIRFRLWVRICWQM